MPDFRLLRLLCLLLLAWLFVAGCRADQATVTILVTQIVTTESEGVVATRVEQRAIEVTPTPPAEDTDDAPVVLDVSMLGNPPQLDPQLAATQNDLDLVENLFVGLTSLNPATGEIEPQLAQSWSISADGRRWTFDLRTDVAWVQATADGANMVSTPLRLVDAHDVVAAVQRACDPASGAAGAFLLYIVENCERINRRLFATPADLANIGVQAVGNHQVVFSLVKPANHFLSLTTMPLMRPLPVEVITQFGTGWTEPEVIVTSGPFLLSPDSVMDRRLVLSRNNLWPASRSGNVDVVNIILLDDRDEAYTLWDNFDIDIALPPTGVVEELLLRNPGKVTLRAQQAVFYIGLNFDSGVLRVPEVRRALSAAIDRDRLVEELFGGEALALRHFTPPGVINAPPRDVVGTGFSPSYAQQQMATSGFGDCRLMPPITLLISGSDLSLRRAEILRDMWFEVLNCGKEQVLVEQAQFGTLLANTRREAGASRPDMWELGWASQYPDANNWLSDVVHCEDSENRQNRPCGQVDELIRRADDSASLSERSALYRQIETMFFADDGIQPLIPLHADAEYILKQVWVTFTPAGFGGEQFDRYLVDSEIKAFEQERR